MNDKNVSFKKIHSEYCDFIDSCGKFSFYTRSKRIQIEKIRECERYVQVIKLYKKKAIEENNENVSNQLFHMQCMINSSMSSLLMWVELKKKDFSKAWSFLVDSQDYVSIALRISDYEGVRDFESRLKSIEESIFPGWKLYNSPGFIETIGKCSICSESFLDCDHIENEIYMGAMCQRVDRKIIETNHIAYVEDPRDKRCIITKVSDDDGNMIDYFTWEKTGENKAIEKGMCTENIILNLFSLDIS